MPLAAAAAASAALFLRPPLWGGSPANAPSSALAPLPLPFLGTHSRNTLARKDCQTSGGRRWSLGTLMPARKVCSMSTLDMKLRQGQGCVNARSMSDIKGELKADKMRQWVL